MKKLAFVLILLMLISIPVNADREAITDYKAHNMILGVEPWVTFMGHPVTRSDDGYYLITTLEGEMRFTPKDMLIIGVKGEIYPCKIDIFQATYEEVKE